MVQPKAAVVKVDDANGFSLSKEEDAKRFLVDLRAADLELRAPERMLLFFFFFAAPETLFLPLPFTVVLTSLDTLELLMAANLANSAVKFVLVEEAARYASFSSLV